MTETDRRAGRHRDGRGVAPLFLALLFGAVTASADVATPPASGGQADAETVKRVLTLLTVVGEEYRESFDETGALARPLEYEEARAFLAEARQHWERLPFAGQSGVTRQLSDLSSAVESRDPVENLLAQAVSVRGEISRTTGVALEDVHPAEPPSPQRGATIFRDHCASCHGESGNGQGPEAARLERKPANFTDRGFMRGETPYDFFHVISLGKRGAAMPAWEDVLSVQERWDVLAYVWRLALPTADLAEGQGIYLSQCAGCHGAAGDGSGPYAPALLTPVPDVTRPAALTQRTDKELFDAVAGGVAGTAMPAFRGLTDDERWKAVAFLRVLSLGGASAGGEITGAGGAGGDEIPATRADADGSSGRPERLGRLARLLAGEYAKAVRAGMVVSPHDLTESEVLAGQMTAAVPAVVASLQAGAPDVARLLPQRVADLAALIERRGSAEEASKIADAIAGSLPATADPERTSGADAASTPDALGETRRLLDQALSAYRSNDSRALYLASDAYFAFEPLERQLTVVAPEITRQVETRFLELRGALARPGAEEHAAQLVAAIGADLDAASAALKPRTNAFAVFVQSATIILREGFEVVLIIGALIAYVVKSGNRHMKRPILLGAAAGVGLSLGTAYALLALLQGRGAGAAEALEGATMLIAAVVLFWVSYWLVSKAEAEKWQRYIQGKVKTALSAGSGVALAGAAFLAVYREGFETVLFYQALFSSAAGAAGMVVGGFVAGAAALAVVYLLFMRFGMGIPIRQFFLGTSVLLYYMAIVFAGKGVAELQEATWIAVTPVAGAPRVDFLGLYPTMETLLAQGVLVVLLLYAVWVTWGRRRPPAAAGDDLLLAEVRELHRLALEIRADLRRHATPDVGTAQQTTHRLDTLIERVADLQGQLELDLPRNGGVKTVGA